MTDRKELTPQDPQSFDSPKVDPVQELGGLVDNDPNAPYLVNRRMSLIFRVKQFVLEGRFPSGVAFYAIAVIGSVFILCSDYQQERSYGENIFLVWSFLSSALIAQVIDVVSRKRDVSGDDS